MLLSYFHRNLCIIESFLFITECSLNWTIWRVKYGSTHFSYSNLHECLLYSRRMRRTSSLLLTAAEKDLEIFPTLFLPAWLSASSDNYSLSIKQKAHCQLKQSAVGKQVRPPCKSLTNMYARLKAGFSYKINTIKSSIFLFLFLFFCFFLCLSLHLKQSAY